MAGGRPRIYASQAERQRAYRARKLGKEPAPEAPVASVAQLEATKPSVDPVILQAAAAARARPAAGGCPAFVPRGTRCKLCGKSH